MTQRVKIGKRLRELRKSRGLTQQELANMLDVTTSAVGMYEQDRRHPNYKVLIQYSKYFNVSIDYIIIGEENDR
jgi:transcriptional regulator with XRE-family HTH domain